MNQSIHTIDLLQWMMGPVVEVTAYMGLLAHERVEVEDTAVAILRFGSGALGIVEGTTAAYPGLTARPEVHGNRGSAIIDNDRPVYFHGAVREGREPLINLEEGRKAVDVILAIYQSARMGQPVRLSGLR